MTWCDTWHDYCNHFNFFRMLPITKSQALQKGITLRFISQSGVGPDRRSFSKLFSYTIYNRKLEAYCWDRIKVICNLKLQFHIYERWYLVSTRPLHYRKDNFFWSKSVFSFQILLLFRSTGYKSYRTSCNHTFDGVGVSRGGECLNIPCLLKE